MDWLQVFVLSIVQGLTEFLPISSSAHLVLVPTLTGWPDQGQAFDVAVHLGTLCAVLTYFAKDLKVMTVDFVKQFTSGQKTEHSRLAWQLGLSTIPAGLAGLLFHHQIETYLRSPLVIAMATLVFGSLLGCAYILGRTGQRSEFQLKVVDIILISSSQALALIPGVSRSGVTMTTGLFRGLSPSAAARISFLMAIPIILLASGLKVIEFIKAETLIDWSSLGAGIVISALSGFVCIHYFIRFLSKIGMMPFVIYRLILGAGLLWYFW